MPKLSTGYSSINDVPDQYRDLYSFEDESNEDGPVILTGIENVFSERDRDQLTKALESERFQKSKAEKSLSAFQDMDPKKYKELSNRVPELEKALEAANSQSAEAIDAAVEERLKPLERRHKEAFEELSEKYRTLEGEKSDLENRLRSRDFNEKMSSAASKANVKPEAIADVVRRASDFGWNIDENGDLKAEKPDGTTWYSYRNPTNVLTLDEYLASILAEEAPHLFKESEGGGAGNGSKGGHFAVKSRKDMLPSEKTAYIRKHGRAAYNELPA